MCGELMFAELTQLMFAELTELLFAELDDLAGSGHRRHRVQALWQVADLPHGFIQLDLDHQRQTKQAP